MPENLKRKVKRAAFGSLAGLLALLLLMQAIFLVVVGGERWVDHTHGVRLAAERLRAGIGNAEAAQRFVLLFGDTTAQARYEAARAETLGALDTMARMVRDNPAQVERVEALRPYVTRRLEDLGRALELELAGDHAGALAAAREGAARAAPIPAALAELQSVEAGLLAKREGRVEMLRLVFVGGGIAMALLLGGLLWRQFGAAVAEVEREERARRELEDLLAEKLRLLREVNHRVGNSLAMVGALLHVQTRASGDDRVRGALEEARTRVNAVGKVHQRIMNAGTVDTLDLGSHLPALCDEVGASLGRPGELVGQVQGAAVVPVETGVALSLLVNELATPALLARPGDWPMGPLRVQVRHTQAGLALTVEDPEGHLDADTDEARSMVIGALSGQLGAAGPTGDGKRFTLDIPLAA